VNYAFPASSTAAAVLFAMLTSPIPITQYRRRRHHDGPTPLDLAALHTSRTLMWDAAALALTFGTSALVSVSTPTWNVRRRLDWIRRGDCRTLRLGRDGSSPRESQSLTIHLRRI
jgi:hypothetical protein